MTNDMLPAKQIKPREGSEFKGEINHHWGSKQSTAGVVFLNPVNKYIYIYMNAVQYFRYTRLGAGFNQGAKICITKN